MPLDVTAYLARIAYRGSREPTLPTLNAIHRAHLLAVPFENLDIVPLGRPIVLDESRLFDKIVTRRRGGFCYELNGLFAALLGSLGYRVSLLSARVAAGEGRFGIPFDHMTLTVALDERWLVDVGFGDSFVEPLRLDTDEAQVRDGVVYRLERGGDERILYQFAHGSRVPQYTFTAAPRRLADFADGCLYHQTSPLSSFTQRRVCTRATAGGRITLSDGRLIIACDGQRRELEFADDAQFRAALREHFGIEL